MKLTCSGHSLDSTFLHVYSPVGMRLATKLSLYHLQEIIYVVSQLKIFNTDSFLLPRTDNIHEFQTAVDTSVISTSYLDRYEFTTNWNFDKN